jgi:hypothetical protein
MREQLYQMVLENTVAKWMVPSCGNATPNLSLTPTTTPAAVDVQQRGPTHLILDQRCNANRSSCGVLPGSNLSSAPSISLRMIRDLL